MASGGNRDYWIGFDLGATKMLAAIVTKDSQIRSRKRKRTRGADGAESVVTRITRTVRTLLEESAVAPEQVRGLGIGVPGPVDQERGLVLQAVNLNWQDLPLAELLADEFGFPAVVLNDVDAGVYGEYRFGSAKSARTALGIFPGTGIGGGCVYNGDIVHGMNSSCMEIGHIPMVIDGQLCGCGRRGCLETEASRLAISAEVAKAAYRGEAPTIMNEVGANLADIRSTLLAKAIANGEKVVEDIVARAARTLGRAVATCVHLLGPDTVVLGGGLVEAMPDLYVNAVAKAARETVMASFTDSFKVVAAKLGDDASVLGAAAWAAKVLA